MSIGFLEGQEYAEAVKASSQSSERDLGDRIAAFIEMRDFAREALVIALKLADVRDGDYLVERWEQLTGEVYGEDYCQREA